MEQMFDIRPEGVVLLDTLSSGDARNYAATRAGFYREELDAAPVRLDSARLSGGAHWLKMAFDFVASPITARTLLVRARTLPDGSEVDPSQPPPVPATAVVTVPGDHAAIVHDDTVVPQAIEDWLLDIEKARWLNATVSSRI
jgi:hypothetical protein